MSTATGMQPQTKHENGLNRGRSLSKPAVSNSSVKSMAPMKSLESSSKTSPSVCGSLLPATIQNKPIPMDDFSDDEKALVFRVKPGLQAKDGVKNGVVTARTSSNALRKDTGNATVTSPVRKESGNATSGNTVRKAAVESSLDQGYDSEEEKPLASKMVSNKPRVTDKTEDSEDSDDEKPLVLRRVSNGISNSHSITKKDDSAAKRRPSDDKEKSESAKKLKLSKTTPGSEKKSTSSLTPKVQSGGVSKAASNTMPKLSVASPKVSTNSMSKPSGEQRKSLSTVSDSAVKMEINEDEDEDDVPLAQRVSGTKNLKNAGVVKKSKNPLVVKSSGVVKKTSGSLTSSVAAKRVVEAKKAKLKQKQKDKKKSGSEKSAKCDKNAPGAGGGQKWVTLKHNGVIFPPPYTSHGVKMLYEGKPVDLTLEQEEVATMFAVMRETDYVKKPQFLSNFWNDWKKLLGPNHVIKNLEGCDFTPIYEWHLAEKEKKKQLTTEEKKMLREEKQKQEDKYMWAVVDGVKEKVGNFRVEPPGLFRGRGEHPKMGKLKKRIFPEDIVINIGKDAPIPECPIPGHRWKEIRHDDTVTWLAYWTDPINPKEFKYVFLAASSSLKGLSDKEKYEKARKLKDYIEDIRRTYTRNLTSSDMTKRQIAVATYLIDRLALRAGNEKDDDEADTVGCCSLKVEHVRLVPPKSLEFDFLGKDSIRYFNTVEVIEPVYKAIGDFKKSKKNGEDLFDKLDTNKLNAHLKNIMPGLTAKVFRTYNASITLDTLLVDTDGHIVQEKIASYQKANKEVAILCNHQRSVSKSHDAQMEKLETKMTELEDLVKELKVDLDRAKRGKPPLSDAEGKPKRNQSPEALEKKIRQTEQKIQKMKLDMRIKDDLKTVALGTSKINYMDPRITVAWCKRHEVPIEKVFNKSLLAKFAWAMDVDMDYRF